MSQAAPHRPCVAVLVKRFPRLSETFVLNEFLELRRLGVPVRLFALEDPKERHVQPAASALRNEVGTIRSGRRAPIGPMLRNPAGAARAIRLAFRRRSSSAWRHLRDALALAAQLRRVNAVHLHAHFAHSPTETAHLVHLITGIPFSFTAHAKDLYTTPRSRIASSGRAAAFVTTCTASNGEYLSSIVGRDVNVYPHGIDVERFASLSRCTVPGRILAIGRLVPKKGFDVLLSSLAILRDRGVAFECRIVGGGPIQEELSSLARRLGLDGRVTFVGPRPQTELLDEYAAAEIFALVPVVTADGDRDGLPNVLLEAMAAGVPVVSSEISGIPELIANGVSGILVPPGDAAALADALERLLTDAQERKRLSAGATAAVARRDLSACVRPLAVRFLAQPALAGAISDTPFRTRPRMSEDRPR